MTDDIVIIVMYSDQTIYENIFKYIYMEFLCAKSHHFYIMYIMMKSYLLLIFIVYVFIHYVYILNVLHQERYLWKSPGGLTLTAF